MEDLLARFEDRRLAREAERQRLQRRLNEIAVEGERDMIAVEQLKLVLSAALKPKTLTEHAAQEVRQAVGNLVYPSAAASQQDGSGLMVKDMVLAIVRDAYPSGLTSKQIRGKAFLRYKQHLNPNTVTVSLVRQSKGDAALVRCEGRTWHYVKPKLNGNSGATLRALNGDAKEKSPEVPGLPE